MEILSEIEKYIELKFTQSYISIVVNGKNNYLYDKRTKPNSIVWFNVKEEEKVDAINKIFDKRNIVYNYNKYKDFSLTYDKNFITKNQDLIKQIHKVKNKEFTIEK